MELEEFLDFIYGEETGYAYSPTKDPDTGAFEKHFFKWPEEKTKLVDHIRLATITHEVYYSPSLFDSPSAHKDAFKGTRFVWVEFDGTAPSELPDGFPEPSYKLQSSNERNQHWYWQLEQFSNDIDLIEDVSQRLAYHLEADLSCWNANRVLRPPGTKHHDSGLLTKQLRFDDHSFPFGAFAGLPELPVRILGDKDVQFIPSPVEVINKHHLKDDDLEFFMAKEQPKGSRSSALAKLGHICMEVGMSNAESLSLLLNADSRWGKFAKRRDRKERLLGIINYCRARHPINVVEEEVKSPLRVYTYEEFINSPVKMEWAVEGLIHKKGILSISGPPGVGKSQLSLRFAERAAMGESFLKWKVPHPMKTLFISMEMAHEELHHLFTESMELPSNEYLRDNMLIMPIGSSIHLNNKVAQRELNKVVEQFRPDGIIFDSLGKAINDEISSDKIVFETFEYVDRTLRNEYGAFVWFVHHPRKGQVGNKQPNALDDLYGSRYISAALTTAIGLRDAGASIEVSCLKIRMAESFNSFRIRRTDNVDFKVIEGQVIDKGSTGTVMGEMFGFEDD